MSQLATILDDGVIRFAARPAIIWKGETLSYAQLSSGVDRLAGAFEAAGAGRGDRIAVIGPNAPCFVLCLFAAWRIGATVVPLSARYRGYELQRTLTDASPRLVISVRSYQGFSFDEFLRSNLSLLSAAAACLFVSSLGELEGSIAIALSPAASAPEPAREGAALVLYTSGTTGEPRGVLIDHALEFAGAVEMTRRLEARADDITALVIPLVHAFGLQCMLAALLVGSAVALLDGAGSLDGTVDALVDSQASVVHGSPTLMNGLLTHGGPGLRGLRTGFVAGARSSPDLLERLDRTGSRILNLYGMTELGALASTVKDDSAAVRRTSCGKPFPGVELRVAGVGSGEILARSGGKTPVYLRPPEAVPAAQSDDWFATGDQGSFDEHGNLTINGRLKELVKVGGFSVFPQEVESLLLLHPEVAQAVVVGTEDPERGELLQAFVVARAGSSLTPAQLLRFARRRIAGYKLPYRMQVVDELPLLSSGKPDRKAIKLLCTQAADGH